MKAVLMTAPGNPEVLQLREINNPLPPQNTELLVRLKAAGVNPIDTKLRDRGTFYPDKMPAILGCDGAGVDLAFDTVGGETFEKTFPAIRIYGDIVTILQPSDSTNWKVARQRNLRIGLELMLTPMLQGIEEAQVHHGEILAECAKWMDEGKLKIYVNRTFGLAEVGKAHQLLETGSMIGKLVIDIG
jgi:NADPH:quinone reductase-like Zn-dependent oxidoreductase